MKVVLDDILEIGQDLSWLLAASAASVNGISKIRPRTHKTDSILKRAMDDCVILMTLERPFARDLKTAIAFIKVIHDYERAIEIGSSLLERISDLRGQSIPESFRDVIDYLVLYHEAVRYSQSNYGASRTEAVSKIESMHEDLKKQVVSIMETTTVAPRVSVDLVLACRHIRRLYELVTEIDWEMREVDKSEKILVLMRGPSGSGKTTLALCIASDPNSVRFSTDDFFAGDGTYKYDKSKSVQAHLWNQERVSEAMRVGKTPIVVDNTNIRTWEMKPYVSMAIKHGYEVKFEKSWSGPWAPGCKGESVVAALAARSRHGVPVEAIARMVDNYEENESLQSILDSKNPYEEEKK